MVKNESIYWGQMRSMELIEQSNRKDMGVFFTPRWVIDFMIDLINSDDLNNQRIKILEPACGVGQFLRRIKERNLFPFSTKVGVELNGEFVDYIYKNKFDENLMVIHYDYLLWETHEKYDIIIGNPPYGIPSLSEHYTIKVDDETKKMYKRIYETWYGKYNIYGAFVEKSIKLLKENGQLIFIIPATFMILDEFKKLRKFLSENGKTEIIYMGQEIFKPYANVSTVILKFTKTISLKNRLLLFDYENGKLKLISKNENWLGDVILFSSDFSKEMDKICSFRLSDIYEVKISPRTPEIRHNPFVIQLKNVKSENLLPILNSKNLKKGKIVYEPTTDYWISNDKKTKLRKFFDKPHIVVGLGFRGDGEIASAYDYKAYPWMGDVYHLLRKEVLFYKDFDLSEYEVVEFLNSEIITRYIKDVFRDITYHLSITQLKLLPLPRREELKYLKELLL